MAVALEFINLIVPLAVVERKCPEIYDGLRAGDFGYWVDDHLACTGAMNYLDINDEVAAWKRRGVTVEANELIIVEGLFMAGLTLCDWLELDTGGRYARKVGTETGPLVGPGARMTPADLVVLNWPECSR